MKKSLTILILLILLLTACVNDEEGVQSGVELSELKESMKVEDFTDLGVWLLEVDAAVLQERLGREKAFILDIAGRSFPLQLNPLNKEQYIAFVPDGVTGEAIESGVILTEAGRGQFQREAAEVVIASVYLLKDDLYYEITLSDYLLMKAADDDFVYESGTLIRPTHVKSSDGYAYTMKHYYDARQVSSEHTVSSAFLFLEGREEHLTQLVFTTNPYRAKIVNDSVQIFPPDTRDRVWQLGEMGTIDESSAFTYDIIDDSNAQTLTLKLKEANLPEKYSQTHAYEIQFNDDATVCVLHEGDTGIFEGIIQYATTSNVDLVKNARFSELSSKPFSLITAGATVGYDTFDDAFNAIGDALTATICVNEATTVAASTEYRVESGLNLTVMTKDGTTVIFDGTASNYFFVSGNFDSTTLNLQGITIRNGSTGSYNAIYVDGANLFLNGCRIVENGTSKSPIYIESSKTVITDTLIASNTTSSMAGGSGGIRFLESVATITNSTIRDNRTTASFAVGGGLYFSNSTATIIDTTITGNRSDMEPGGGIYLLSSAVQLISSTVTHNITGNSDTGGGGICEMNGSLTLEDTLIASNTAKNGGGIYQNDGSLTLNKTTVSFNTANPGGGGGIYQNDGSLMLVKTIVSSNTANSNGGGIYGCNNLDIDNCTITHNETGIMANNGGGVFLLNYDTVSISSSYIAHNRTSQSGGGVYLEPAISSVFSLDDTLITGNTANLFAAGNSGSGGGLYCNTYQGSFKTGESEWQNPSGSYNDNISIDDDGTIHSLTNDSVKIYDNILDKDAPNGKQMRFPVIP